MKSTAIGAEKITFISEAQQNRRNIWFSSRAVMRM